MPVLGLSDIIYPDKYYPDKGSSVQLAKGIEWTTHICTVLALLPDRQGLSVDALAEFFEIPAAYLSKQMQLLRRAGIVQSVRGKGGGYRLARPVDEITLLDIVHAIEGSMPAFRCTEIRQNGPCGLHRGDCRKPCEIAAAFAAAERVYHAALAQRTVASIMQEAAMNASPEHLIEMVQWIKRQTG
ncbi:MAG: RrF2 family transcriptional regulator [Erythrobacter sp.]